jgi:hypothetical protein
MKPSVLGRFPLALLVATVLSVLAGASPASASVTVGQLAPTTPTTNCGAPVDRVQATVSSGNSYLIPTNGTITSWSTNAGAVAGELKLKVYRHGSGDVYTVIGQEGPHQLALSAINTFPANVQVKAGDLLGLNSFSGATSCSFDFPGDSYLRTTATSDAANGESGTFDLPVTDRHLNISAVVAPTNTFALGATTRNKKKGTATLTFNNLPNPGDLAGSGQGAQVASTGAVTSKAVQAGTATLLVKATGKKKKKLNAKGKVKLNLAVTYTPTGGDPNTQLIKVKLKKKLKKRL